MGRDSTQGMATPLRFENHFITLFKTNKPKVYLYVHIEQTMKDVRKSSNWKVEI